MDLTRWWVAARLHGGKLSAAALGVLLFAAGWQAGRFTSPYYSAHPIIFEDSASGSRGELTTLREQGHPTAAPNDTPRADALAVPAVAGSSTESIKGKFVGSLNSDLYHHIDCPLGRRIKEENQVWFDSLEEAQAAGYKPSKCTQEKLDR